MYGEEDRVLTAASLVDAYKSNQLQANKICKQSAIILKGYIAGMGSNSLGNYIDLKNDILGFSEDSDIRIFLDNSNENSEAIKKIKSNGLVRVIGLCQGQIEVFGAKSKIIIGSARILKIGAEFL